MIHKYRRCSTDAQELGPKAQSDAIERWMLSNGADEFLDYFDNGVSGSIPLSERPEGGKMTSSLKGGDIVVVSKLDRLFRSVADAATTLEYWMDQNIKMVSISESLDMTNAYSRAMVQIISVFAELERQLIRDRTKSALAAKKARGEPTGGAPYGWKYVDSVLVKVPEEIDVLLKIRLWRSASLSYQRIAGNLNRMGIKPRSGRKWNTSSLFGIVKKIDRLEK